MRVILIPIMEKIVWRGVIKLKDLVTGVGMRGGVAGKAMKSSPLLGPFCGFRILGFYSVENTDRLGVFMFQSWDNIQLCIDSQYSSQ